MSTVIFIVIGFVLAPGLLPCQAMTTDEQTNSKMSPKFTDELSVGQTPFFGVTADAASHPVPFFRLTPLGIWNQVVNMPLLSIRIQVHKAIKALPTACIHIKKSETFQEPLITTRKDSGNT